MVRIIEVRTEQKRVTRGESKEFRVIIVRQVNALRPLLRSQRMGIVGTIVLRERIDVHFRRIVELRRLILLTQQLVFERERGVDRIRALAGPSQIGNGNGVTVVDHITQVIGGQVGVIVQQHPFVFLTGCGRHEIIFARVEISSANLIILLTSNGHVRHRLVGFGENIITVVLIVLRVGQREVRSELDAIRHIVVQSQTRRETVEALFDDRTYFVVIRSRHAERGLFTTTGDVHTVVVHLTDLRHLFHPVRVLIIVGIISRTVGEIHQLNNAGSRITLFRIEVSLLQHHRIAGTIEHVQSLRLPRARKTVVETDTRLTTASAACGDFDHTIRTARTPDGSCGSILQDLDAGDIVGRHLQQSSELLLVVQV